MGGYRPHVVLLADTPESACGLAAKAQAEALKDLFTFTIEYTTKDPNLSYPFDIIHVLSWEAQCHRPLIQDGRPVIREVSDFRWAYDEAFGKLSPRELCNKYIGDASHVVTPSKKLQTKLAGEVQATIAPHGFDPAIFKVTRKRSGPLIAGWTGDTNDASKGFQDILEPAAQDCFDLRVQDSKDGKAAPEQMGEFYNELDVFCIASIAEGQPLTLIESMACGCFPICTDVGLAPELITDKKNGLIVKRTPAAFHEALSWCASNIQHVREQGLKNAERMAKTRTWAHTSKGLRRVYLNTLNEYKKQTENNEPLSPQLSHEQIIAKAKENYEKHYVMQPAHKTPLAVIRGIYAGYDAELWPLLPKDKLEAVLEIGVGYGYLLQYLGLKNIKQVDGLEINNELYKQALKQTAHVPGNLFHCDAMQQLPLFADDTYDAIVAFDLIEHFTLEQAYALLFQIRRILRPGGVAVFRTPNMANLFGCYSAHLDLTHIHCYTEHSFRQLLRIAGFVSHGVYVHPNRKGSGTEQSVEFQRQFYKFEGRTPSVTLEKNFTMWAKK